MKISQIHTNTKQVGGLLEKHDWRLKIEGKSDKQAAAWVNTEKGADQLKDQLSEHSMVCGQASFDI